MLAVLSATIVLDQVDIAVVLVAMFLLGTAETFADTTATTLLPMIVDTADLGIGNARIMAGIVTINQLAGPPVGAALFAAGPVVPVRRPGRLHGRQRGAGLADRPATARRREGGPVARPARDRRRAPLALGQRRRCGRWRSRSSRST